MPLICCMLQVLQAPNLQIHLQRHQKIESVSKIIQQAYLSNSYKARLTSCNQCSQSEHLFPQNMSYGTSKMNFGLYQRFTMKGILYRRHGYLNVVNYSNEDGLNLQITVTQLQVTVLWLGESCNLEKLKAKSCFRIKCRNRTQDNRKCNL